MDVKSWIIFLKKHKSFTAVSLAGFALSISMMILLVAYISQQYHTDDFQKNADRIFAIGNDDGFSNAYWLHHYLEDNFPGIERASTFSLEWGNSSVAGKKEYTPVAFADTSFFDIFSFRIINGNIQDWKGSKNNAVISESLSYSLFNNENPIGKPVKINMGSDVMELTVSAVMKDIANSVIPYCGIIAHGEWRTLFNRANNPAMQNIAGHVNFVMASPGVQLTGQEENMLAFFKEINYVPYTYGIYDKVNIVPLKELYFTEQGTDDCLRKGNKLLIDILSVFCIVLVIFSVLNYASMSIALSGFRAKEMSIRNLLGESRSGIFARVYKETFLMCIISMAFAVIMAQLFSRPFSAITDCDISVFNEMNTDMVVTIFGIIAAIVLLSGVIPAIMNSCRERSVSRKNMYCNVITILQMFFTGIMISFVVGIGYHIRSMFSAPMGYNTRNILVIDTDIFDEQNDPFLFREVLSALPCVERVGLGNQTPLNCRLGTMLPYSGRPVSFRNIEGDENYFAILGMERKADYHSVSGMYFNEYAFEMTGTDNEARELVFDEGLTLEVSGIYYDFVLGKLLSAKKPAILKVFRDYPENRYPGVMLVELADESRKTFSEIETAFNLFEPGSVFQADFIDNQIEDTFRHERTILYIISMFTLLIVLVSSMGLIGISIINMRYKTKSVAIRKAFGMSMQESVCFLLKPYILKSIIAVCLSIPVAYFLIDEWMKDYSYKVEIVWWIFALSAAVSIAVSLMSTLCQSVIVSKTSIMQTIRQN